MVPGGGSGSTRATIAGSVHATSSSATALGAKSMSCLLRMRASTPSPREIQGAYLLTNVRMMPTRLEIPVAAASIDGDEARLPSAIGALILVPPTGGRVTVA